MRFTVDVTTVSSAAVDSAAPPLAFVPAVNDVVMVEAANVPLADARHFDAERRRDARCEEERLHRLMHDANRARRGTRRVRADLTRPVRLEQVERHVHVAAAQRGAERRCAVLALDAIEHPTAQGGLQEVAEPRPASELQALAGLGVGVLRLRGRGLRVRLGGDRRPKFRLQLLNVSGQPLELGLLFVGAVVHLQQLVELLPAFAEPDRDLLRFGHAPIPSSLSR